MWPRKMYLSVYNRVCASMIGWVVICAKSNLLDEMWKTYALDSASRDCSSVFDKHGDIGSTTRAVSKNTQTLHQLSPPASNCSPTAAYSSGAHALTTHLHTHIPHAHSLRICQRHAMYTHVYAPWSPCTGTPAVPPPGAAAAVTPGEFRPVSAPTMCC